MTKLSNKKPQSNIKVALIHDWLVTNGGAEKVLRSFLSLYPTADIYTLVDFLPTEDRAWLKDHKIHTSFIQKLPFARKHFRHYFPLFPVAIEQFDLSDYDLILSSSWSVAKGVISGPEQTHVSYCHSPARYAWDLQGQYLKLSGLEKGIRSVIVRYFLYKFRIWDAQSSNGIDKLISNSNFVRKRISKCYRRDSTLIYPPVDVDRFQVSVDKDDYYLACSRFVPYKRIDLIVRAFVAMPDRQLKVVGDGPEMEKICTLARGANNITILGFKSDQLLVKYIQKAKAFIFASEEDFGILPVEAQACGTPVIAYGKGGSLETVVDGVSGIHFDEQTEDSLISAINKFEQISDELSVTAIRANAERFSNAIFEQNIMHTVQTAIER